MAIGLVYNSVYEEASQQLEDMDDYLDEKQKDISAKKKEMSQMEKVRRSRRNRKREQDKNLVRFPIYKWKSRLPLETDTPYTLGREKKN